MAVMTALIADNGRIPVALYWAATCYQLGTL